MKNGTDSINLLSLTYKYVSLIASFFLVITSMSMSATRKCDKFGNRKCDSQMR